MQNSLTPRPAADGFLDLGAIWADTSHWIGDHGDEVLIGAGIAALIVAALVLVRRGLDWLLRRIDARTRQESSWADVSCKLLAATRMWFFVILAVEIVIAGSRAGPGIKLAVGTLFVIATTIQVALWVRTLLLGIVKLRIEEDGDQSRLGNAFSVIRVLVSVLLFGIAFVVILDNLGVNVTALVAGLGIGGIAIGLAAQGIFSDLFSALAILFDRPFKRGDVITFDQTTGIVETIGLKTTRLRSISGEQIVIANTQLLDKRLGNYSNLGYRRVDFMFGVIYQTPPEKLRRIPDIVAALVDATPQCTLLRCAMTGFGASDLQFQLQFDVLSTDLDEMYQARQAICIGMVERFAEEGIEFAYPTQTTFTAAPDGRMVMPYVDHLSLRPAKDFAGDAVQAD